MLGFFVLCVWRKNNWVGAVGGRGLGLTTPEHYCRVILYIHRLVGNTTRCGEKGGLPRTPGVIQISV